MAVLHYFRYQQTKDEKGRTSTHNQGALTQEDISVFYNGSEVLLRVACSKADLTKWLKLQTDIELEEIDKPTFALTINQTPQGENIRQLRKQERTRELKECKASLNNGSFNTDETSMDRMTRYLSIANAKFNMRLAAGDDPQKALEVYNQRVSWKSAENEYHDLTIRDIAEILECGTNRMQELWEMY